LKSRLTIWRMLIQPDKVSSRVFAFELDEALEARQEVPDPIRTMQDFDNPNTPFYGVYTQSDFVATDFSVGQQKYTGNPLNIALDGPGFLAVDTPEGTRYTRQGSYAINRDGELVTPEGHRVRGSGLRGLGAGELTIDHSGNVLIDGQETGRLDIVEFENQRVLRKVGDTFYAQPPGADLERQAEQTTVRQGYVELANMSMVAEMVNLIEINRLYETYHRQMTTSDQMVAELLELMDR
jgi:flagellar basal-body rod protein FlgF